MYKHLIGKRSNKVKNVVERGLVKRFAEAIGDLHPIYIEGTVGENSQYGVNIAPPTFPRVFDYGKIEGLKLPEKGLIHGEQIYHYERPLQVGEELNCYSVVKDYYEKNGSSGSMAFLVVTRYGEDLKGNIIFIEEMTTIITEAVKKAMMI
jgi:hypothetical protein